MDYGDLEYDLEEHFNFQVRIFAFTSLSLGQITPELVYRMDFDLYTYQLHSESLEPAFFNYSSVASLLYRKNLAIWDMSKKRQPVRKAAHF